MKQWVQEHYPNTPLGITEYNWGAEDHINGATAQADILGIFGREGLDVAARWTTPDAKTPTFKAMQMYRNYDGRKSTFGEQSVRCTVPNPDEVSAFAALRTNDKALTIMLVNKQLKQSANISFDIQNFAIATTAQAWQLTNANQITKLDEVPLNGERLQMNIPAQSVTLLVLPAR
jgi:alpha-L-arabinofuranosidase